MPKNLEGKIILVTGGSSGIGRASSITFAKEGASVVIADIDAEGGNETLSLIKTAGGKAGFVKTDVSDSKQVEYLFKTIKDTYGKLDFAINVAGIEGAGGCIADFPEDMWNHVIDVNLKGVWLCMKYEIRQMLGQGGGCIVNMSSVHGLRGNRRGMPAYIASKFGIVGLTEAAATEYGKDGIRVYALCPGGVRTVMQERLKATKEQIARMSPPEEPARAAMWLFLNQIPAKNGDALTSRKWKSRS